MATRYLLLYPGRCPGLGAYAPSGRAIEPAIESLGTEAKGCKVLFTFLPFYSFTFRTAGRC